MRKFMVACAAFSLLMGCSDFEKQTYAILVTAESVHVAVNDAAVDAKIKALITQKEAVAIANALDVYHGSFLATKVIFEAYKEAKGKDKENLKEEILRGLNMLLEDQAALKKIYGLIFKGIQGAESWEALTRK